ncbi:MAG: hypothetical protein RI637_05865 [Acidimicrobiia bacterium]|nr:hypothetical protein [Acidimicrobiia bacterium]
MTTPAARNARAEANALLPPGHEARVLEPSPPANPDPDWYADDPTDPEGATGTIVTPIPGEGITWTELAASRSELTEFAAQRWLGSYRRLEELPAQFREGRDALHQLAYFAVAPKRYEQTGKLALRYTHGGFGTPFFGADEQVRVHHNSLIRQHGDIARWIPITTLRAATDFLGIRYQDIWFDGFRDPLGPVGADVPLSVDPAVTTAVGDWFGFGTSVLEQARRLPGAEEVSRVQLWPEHFDTAVEMGSHDLGRRAGYGASPGDEAHPEPYLYVAAWGEIDRSDGYWNDENFNGASLSYRSLLAAGDQRETALAFFRQGFDRLTG